MHRQLKVRVVQIGFNLRFQRLKLYCPAFARARNRSPQCRRWRGRRCWEGTKQRRRAAYRDDTAGLSERWVQDRGYTVKPHPPDRQGWVSHKGAQNQTIQLSHFIGRCPYLRFPEVDAVYFLLSTLSHYFSKY